MNRMKEMYNNEVAPALMQKFQYKSVMQIPKLDKIVVSVGCGDCKDNAKALDAVIKDITAITGQKAVATVAKKSVANFKLREGMHVGVKVTLRHDRMWEFLDSRLLAWLQEPSGFVEFRRTLRPVRLHGQGADASPGDRRRAGPAHGAPQYAPIQRGRHRAHTGPRLRQPPRRQLGAVRRAYLHRRDGDPLPQSHPTAARQEH